MNKFLAVIMIAAMALSCTSCSEKKTTVTENETVAPMEETGVSDIETVAVGNKISTDFVDISVEEAGIVNSLRQSIKAGNITRTFGPEDSAETEYAYIKGKIMNKATSSINDGIFTEAKVGEYTFEDGDLTIYKSDGDTVWGELTPLVEYNYMLYVEIPNALIDGMESCDFNFAFDENLENVLGKEFADRAYKYTTKIVPEKVAN